MTIDTNTFLFLTLLFLVAMLYSSIGHGGASGYLAIMALFGIETGLMRSSALTLNIFVSGIAFFHYYRAGHFHRKLLLPFVMTSMPAAFIGGMIVVDAGLYKSILASCLLIASLRIVINPGVTTKRNVQLPAALLAGLFIGFFSGLIGIGGGILLSPLLLLAGWADIKQTAAASSAFIFVNSAAALAGNAFSGIVFPPQIISWIFVALLGGMAGAYTGSRVLKNRVLHYLLAALLFFAGGKMFFS